MQYSIYKNNIIIISSKNNFETVFQLFSFLKLLSLSLSLFIGNFYLVWFGHMQPAVCRDRTRGRTMLAQVSAKPTSSFDVAKLRETLELAETMAAENNRHRAARTNNSSSSSSSSCHGGGKRSRKQSTEPQFVPPKQLLMYLVR